MNQSSDIKRQLMHSHAFREKLDKYLDDLDTDAVYQQLYDFWWDYINKQDIDFTFLHKINTYTSYLWMLFEERYHKSPW